MGTFSNTWGSGGGSGGNLSFSSITSKLAFDLNVADATGISSKVGSARLNAVNGNQFKGDGIVYFTIIGLLSTDVITAESLGVPTCTVNDRLDIANGIEMYMVSVTRDGSLWAKYACCEGMTSSVLFDISGNKRHAYGVGSFISTHWTTQQSKFYLLEIGHNAVLKSPAGVSSVIDTHYIVKLNTEIEIYGKFNSLLAGAQSYMAGTEFSAASACRMGIYANNFRCNFCGSVVVGGAADLMFHTFKVNKTGYYIDGNLKGTYSPTYTESSLPLWLFGNNGASQSSKFSMAYCVIRENGIVVRNYIPQNGGMLDLVSGEVHGDVITNQTQMTGTFEIIPVPAQISGNNDALGNPLIYLQDGKSIIPLAKYSFSVDEEIIKTDTKKYRYLYTVLRVPIANYGSGIPTYRDGYIRGNGKDKLVILKRETLLTASISKLIDDYTQTSSPTFKMRLYATNPSRPILKIKLPVGKKISISGGEGIQNTIYGQGDVVITIPINTYRTDNVLADFSLSGNLSDLTYFESTNQKAICDLSQFVICQNLTTLKFIGAGISTTILQGEAIWQNAIIPSEWKNISIDLTNTKISTKGIDTLLKNLSESVASGSTGSIILTGGVEVRSTISDNYLATLTGNGFTITGGTNKHTIGFTDINSKIPLYQKTYLADTIEQESNINPSVLDFGNTPWNGYRFWQVNTPLGPASGESNIYENPSIYVSNDGYTFIIPPGLTNPIMPNVSGFNADTSLYFENNVMYVIYKERGARDIIVIVSSIDGITWGNKYQLWTSADGSEDVDLTTPNIVKNGSIYEIYYNNFKADGTDVLVRRTATSLHETYTSRQNCTLKTSLGVDITDLWHFDVKKIGSEYVMVLGLHPGNHFWLATSTNGIDFIAEDYPFILAEKIFDFTGVYRPSITIMSDGSLRIYYSAFDDNAHTRRTIYTDAFLL